MPHFPLPPCSPFLAHPFISPETASRLPLLHERLPALLIILAGETGIHQLLAKFQIPVSRVFADLRDNLFARFDGQGRVARDGLRVFVHKTVQFLPRHCPVDKPHIVGFRCVELSGGEQNLFGTDGTDKGDQRLQPAVAVAEPQLGCGDPEF